MLIKYFAGQNQYLKSVTEEPLTEEEMEAIRLEDKNCRLVKGQVFLWEGARGWEEIWDI